MDELIAMMERHGALFVFFATLAARVGAPVPASPLLVVAGGLTVAGSLDLVGVFFWAVLANLLGDAVWFAAGRRYGARVLGLLCRVSLSPDSCVRQSESLIVRWGGSSLIAAKFVPGVSVVAAPMAGAVGMSVPRFVAYGLLGGAVWSALFLGLGVAFADEVAWLLDAMAQAGGVAAILLVAAVGLFVAARWWRRRRFLRRADAPRITGAELEVLLQQGNGPVLIDVRSAAAVALDPRRLPGAQRIDLAEVASHASEWPREREIVIYCDCPAEASAALAAHALAVAGRLRVRPLAGGLTGWVDAGRPLDPRPHASRPGASSPPGEVEAAGARQGE